MAVDPSRSSYDEGVAEVTYTQPTTFGTVVGTRSALVEAAAAALEELAPEGSDKRVAPAVTAVDRSASFDFFVRPN